MIEEILSALNLERYQVIKKKHGSVPQITAGELIEVTMECGTIPEIAAHFNVSVQTINRIMRSTFPDVRLTGKRTWKYYFLGVVKKKQCNYCEQVLDTTAFYNANQPNSLTNLSSICKSCDNIKRNERLTLSNDADLSIISSIYAGCPAGYHVDHIVPVSRGGLHHQDNLCYLPAKLNIAKSDKMPEDVPEIMAHAIYPELSC